ncbi:MAG: hypothetical protein GY880_12540 [Planctomycetaceae bacterium]|nr:hypothetical protein [Planctomycetaceae bacterium]
MKLDEQLQRQFVALALHRFDNVREPLVATIAFLVQAEKGMPTQKATLQDAENGARVYLRFSDSGRAYACSKQEVKNLRRWFGDDLEQWYGKQVQISPVVRAGIAGKEVRKLSLSAV